jgi:hypothetical protein
MSVFTDDFSEATLDSNYWTLNTWTYGYNPGWWTGNQTNATFDAANDRIILRQTSGTNRIGEAELSGFDLTDGFTLAFDAVVHRDIVGVQFCKQSANVVYELIYDFGQSYLRIQKRTGGTVSVLGTVTISGGYSGRLSVEVRNGILTAKYGTTTLYTGAFNDTITNGLTFFGGSGNTPNTPTTIKNISLTYGTSDILSSLKCVTTVIPPVVDSLKCVTKITPPDTYLVDEFDTGETLSDKWDSIGSGYSIENNRLIQTLSGQTLVSKPFAIYGDFLFKMLLNANDGLNSEQGQSLGFYYDYVGYDRSKLEVKLNPIDNTIYLNLYNWEGGFNQYDVTLPCDCSIDNLIEVQRKEGIWQVILNGLPVLSSSPGFYDKTITVFQIYRYNGQGNAVTKFDYMKFGPLPEVDSLLCITTAIAPVLSTLECISKVILDANHHYFEDNFDGPALDRKKWPILQYGVPNFNEGNLVSSTEDFSITSKPFNCPENFVLNIRANFNNPINVANGVTINFIDEYGNSSGEFYFQPQGVGDTWYALNGDGIHDTTTIFDLSEEIGIEFSRFNSRWSLKINGVEITFAQEVWDNIIQKIRMYVGGSLHEVDVNSLYIADPSIYSSLECITTVTPIIKSLKCISNHRYHIFHTGFKGQTIEPPMYLNDGIYWGNNSNVAELDTVNHRVNLIPNIPTVLYPHSLAGNLNIREIANISDGFIFNFSIGGAIQGFSVLVDKDADINSNIYDEFYRCYIISGYPTGFEVRYIDGFQGETQLKSVLYGESLVGNYTVEYKDGLLSLFKEGSALILDVPVNSFTKKDIVLYSEQSREANNPFEAVWIDNLDVKEYPIIDSLKMEANVRPNTNISSLKAVTNVRGDIWVVPLKCISNIHTRELLRTSFDGEVLDANLSFNSAVFGLNENPLDTLNHRLRMSGMFYFHGDKIYFGALWIQNLDTIPKGFSLNFDFSLETIEIDELAIQFNRVPDPIMGESFAGYWNISYNKISNQIIVTKRVWALTPPFGSYLVTTVAIIPFLDSMVGKWELECTHEGIVNLTINHKHIITDLDMGGNLENNRIIISSNAGSSWGTSYLDNLVVKYSPVKSVLSCTTNIRSPHRRDELPCKTSIGKRYSKILTLQGSIFEDDPQKPASNIDKLIFLKVNEVVFPNMISWDTDKQGNNKNSTFNITYRSAEDLLLFTGQKIRLTELHGNPDGFYIGIIDDIVEDNKTGERLWKITGRGEANPIITQPFHINAVTFDDTQPVSPDNQPPTAFTSEMWLNMILFGSEVKKGPCVDIHVEEIWNQNHVYNGFAGNWNTKADAITELMALISKLRKENISWFLDSTGLLRIFNTDVMDEDMGIAIGLNEGRVLDHSIKESAESIINSQRATGGKDNQYEYEGQDIYSRNGWHDTDNGLNWPGYGFMPGKQIQDNSVTEELQLKDEVDAVLELNSMPIFTISMRLSKFPGVEIGQPVYIKDHYKLKGKTMVVTSVRMSGTTSQRTTQITATTDKKILGPLSEFGTAEAIAKHQIAKTAPTYGYCVSTDRKGTVTIQPVDKKATENAKDLGFFKHRDEDKEGEE